MKDGGLCRTICEWGQKALSMEVDPVLVVARKTKPLPGASSTAQRTGEIVGPAVS